MYRSACSSDVGFLADRGSAWISERAKRRLGAQGRSHATVTDSRPYQPFRCPAHRPSGEHMVGWASHSQVNAVTDLYRTI